MTPFGLIPTLDIKDPRETCVLTFDATPQLAPDETLTGTPTVQITAQAGADNPPALVLSGVVINSAPLTVAGNSISVGAGVQAVSSVGIFASRYLIAITCTTSNPDKILTLKAVLPMSAQ